MFRGEVSPARVLRLITALPKESRFVKAVAGPKSEWTTTDYLLAATVDTLASANWQRGGGKGAKPKPIPRPGAARNKTVIGRTKLSQDQIRQYLDNLKEGKLANGN